MLARKEAKYTGVYILIGEQDGEPLAYIGEGEDISYRSKNHDAKKDWWTLVVLITSTENNLHKAHVKFLESRLIEEARSIKRTRLENGVVPARASLSEAAQANMEVFLKNLFMVLPALRVDMFVRNTRSPKEIGASTSINPKVKFELVSLKRGVRASSSLTDGEFVVDAGSRALGKWSQSTNHVYAALHASLVKQGALVPDGSHLMFNKSYAFDSPSAAAAVVLGRAANGTTEWRTKDTGQTYKEWELAQINLAVDVELQLLTSSQQASV